MIGMKTFVVVNGIVGFTLLSSCSARPMHVLVSGDKEFLRSGAASIEAADEAHPLLSPPVKIPHSNLDPQHGTAILEKAEANRIEVETSLKRLQDNRLNTVERQEQVTTPSTKSVRNAVAFTATTRGIQKETKAHKALARGRFEEAKKLANEAMKLQQKAFASIQGDKATFLLGLQKHTSVQTEVTKLNKQAQEYYSLPTKPELLAVLESLEKDFPPKVSKTTSAANQDISTQLKTQRTSGSAMRQDTPDRESLPNNQYIPSAVNAPEKSTAAKVKSTAAKVGRDLVRSIDKARLRSALSSYSFAFKAAELQAVGYLRGGDRAKAVETIQQMRGIRELFLDVHKRYMDKGYGTIGEKAFRGPFSNLVQHEAAHQFAMMKIDDKISPDGISPQKVEEIKERLKLRDEGSKPSSSDGM